MAIYAVFGGLWLTGCFWLMLHELFARPGEFGLIAHPWEPGLLRLHGWIAVGGVFLLGWVSSRHVNDRWAQAFRRPSGLAVTGAAIVLALSGYALYYTTDALHDVAALAHEVLGAGGILFALLHWRRYRPRLTAVGDARKSPPDTFPAL